MSYPPPMLDLPPDENPDTWRRTAVEQLEMALDGPQDYEVRRVRLYRVVDAIIRLAQEAARAEKD